MSWIVWIIVALVAIIALHGVYRTIRHIIYSRMATEAESWVELIQLAIDPIKRVSLKTKPEVVDIEFLELHYRIEEILEDASHQLKASRIWLMSTERPLRLLQTALKWVEKHVRTITGYNPPLTDNVIDDIKDCLRVIESCQADCRNSAMWLRDLATIEIALAAASFALGGLITGLYALLGTR